MNSPNISEEAFLLEMYKVQVSRSEHFEGLRTSISNLLLAVSAALIGYTASNAIGPKNIPMIALVVIFLGVFGFVASALHAKRARRHGLRAASYREVLALCYPKFQVAYKKVPREKTYLNVMWGCVHLAVVGVGIVLLLTGLLSGT